MGPSEIRRAILELAGKAPRRPRHIMVRLSDEEYDLVKQTSAGHGIAMSSLARATLLVGVGILEQEKMPPTHNG